MMLHQVGVNVTTLVMLCFALIVIQPSEEDTGLALLTKNLLWHIVQLTTVTLLAVKLPMDSITFHQ